MGIENEATPCTNNTQRKQEQPTKKWVEEAFLKNMKQYVKTNIKNTGESSNIEKGKNKESPARRTGLVTNPKSSQHKHCTEESQVKGNIATNSMGEDKPS